MPKTQEEIREANRIRQAKFYADKANRERVLGKKTNKYDAVKQSEGKVVTRKPRSKPIETIVELLEEPTQPPTRTFTQEVVKIPANTPAQPKVKSTATKLVVQQETIHIPAPIVDNKIELTEMIKVPAGYSLVVLMEEFKIFVKKQMKPTDEYKFIEVSLKTPVIVSEQVLVAVPPQTSKPSTRSPRSKQLKPQPIPETATESVPEPVQEQIQVQDEEQDEEPANITLDSKKLTEIFNKVEKLILKTNLTSAQKYANSLKTTIKVLNPKDYNDFVRMLKDEPNESFYKLTTYEFKPNQIYKPNSLKTYVHGIVVFLTYIKTGISKEKFELWDDEWKLLKAQSKKVTAQKKLTEVVPTFNDFFDKVKAKYSEYSVQVLLMKLYEKFPKRSDFYLKVVKSKQDAKDKEENYLVINNKFATIILNAHKTFKEVEEHKLDDELTEYLKEYIKFNKIIVGEYLIKNKNMSDTISKMKQKLGYLTGGAVNFIRQVRASDVRNTPNSTPKDDLKIAKQMNHSLESHEHYIRNAEAKK
jgi:hypothetical protein